MIYLDSASTTPISDEVMNEMIPYLTTKFGNPNSIHGLGIEARKAIDKAREQVAAIINADPSQIIFTSGGSEANNLAIHGIKKVFPAIDYVSSMTEHTSSIKALEEEGNKSVVSFIEDTENNYTFDAMKETLVWRMYVNNEVGKVNDVYKIGGICNGNDNLFFGTDCVQALGFERIDVKEMRCDFLSMSAHKIHGPKGVGALYVRDKNFIEPIINGGVNQEFGIRGGTENVAGIVGFGKACEVSHRNQSNNRDKVLYLRQLFLKQIDGENYSLNCTDDSKILSIQFHDVDAETMVLMLSSHGIAISAGSACRNKELEANAALMAYGLQEDSARKTVRFSFMESLTESDIIKTTKKCKEIINYLR